MTNKTKIATKKHTINHTKKHNRKYNDSSNQSNDSNDTKSFTIRFTSNKFLSHTQSIIKRGPKLKINKKDLFTLFITDNQRNLIAGKTIYNKKLDKYIFNESESKCICKNILNFHVGKPLPDECECDYMKNYGSQGKSGAKIHSIRCGKNNNILKIVTM